MNAVEFHQDCFRQVQHKALHAIINPHHARERFPSSGAASSRPMDRKQIRLRFAFHEMPEHAQNFPLPSPCHATDCVEDHLELQKLVPAGFQTMVI
jgi:hypothetical protein